MEIHKDSISSLHAPSYEGSADKSINALASSRKITEGLMNADKPHNGDLNLNPAMQTSSQRN
jgi:hypothetical protein